MIIQIHYIGPNYIPIIIGHHQSMTTIILDNQVCDSQTIINDMNIHEPYAKITLANEWSCHETSWFPLNCIRFQGKKLGRVACRAIFWWNWRFLSGRVRGVVQDVYPSGIVAPLIPRWINIAMDNVDVSILRLQLYAIVCYYCVYWRVIDSYHRFDTWRQQTKQGLLFVQPCWHMCQSWGSRIYEQQWHWRGRLCQEHLQLVDLGSIQK